MKKNVLQVIKAVVVVAASTIVLMLFLAFLLFKFNLPDGAITAGIFIIYILSNFFGGFLIGKVRGEKKFIWGIIVGLVFFVSLSILSFIVTGELYGSGLRAVGALASCVAGGMAGGMCS